MKEQHFSPEKRTRIHQISKFLGELESRWQTRQGYSQGPKMHATLAEYALSHIPTDQQEQLFLLMSNFIADAFDHAAPRRDTYHKSHMALKSYFGILADPLTYEQLGQHMSFQVSGAAVRQHVERGIRITGNYMLREGKETWEQIRHMAGLR